MKNQKNRNFILSGNCFTDTQKQELAKTLFKTTNLTKLVVEAEEGRCNRCAFDGENLKITYAERAYIFRALGHVVGADGPFIKEEKREFSHFGTMIDCSRNGVYTLKAIKEFIRYLAICGYNSLQLYTEDTYLIEGEPYFGYMRGAYTKEELIRLDTYAKEYGVELIPCIQTLAHLEGIFRWAPYARINDVNDILLVGEERTYELIEKMFSAVAERFTSRRINIGMDEAFLMGFGKHYDIHGYTDRIELMTKHLNRVLRIAEKYGFECSMWSDTFYRLGFGGYYSEDAKEFPFDASIIPSNVNLIYWDYYSKSEEHYKTILSQHKRLTNRVWFAGALWTFLGFLPNNTFSIEAAKASLKACKDEKIDDVFFTTWGDFGAECSIFGILPSLVYVAETAYGNFDEDSVKNKFYRLFGVPFDGFTALEKADKVGNVTGEELTDPSKYMLYNDCFAGILDTTVTVLDGGEYAAISKELSKYVSHERWENLFRTAKALCDVLEYKVCIGIKTREAYVEKNKKKLKKLAENDYSVLIKRLKEFYKAFTALWHEEKSGYGFEVSNYRLGGLIERVEYCKRTLVNYCKGKITSIDQLEEKLLDYYGNGEKYTKRLGYINEFLKIASVNKI